jgi:hypothetical protein
VSEFGRRRLGKRFVVSGIFVSYSRVDRELAARIVSGLRALGVDVWWDEDMPGVDWQEELKRQLGELSAVLVIWSAASSGSKNVMAEARLGDRKEKLINIIWGVASPPPPFDAINGLPLGGWTGREPHNGWSRVVRTVEDFLVRSGNVDAGQVTSALAARERTIRGQQDAIALSLEAYQVAQTAEAAASEAHDRASAVLTAAEEQLRWMVERHATAAVVRAAQTEIDEALRTKSGAEERQRDAAGQLANASRAMTRAKAELERMLEEGTVQPLPKSAPSGPSESPSGVSGGAFEADPPDAESPVADAAMGPATLPEPVQPVVAAVIEAPSPAQAAEPLAPVGTPEPAEVAAVADPKADAPVVPTPAADPPSQPAVQGSAAPSARPPAASGGFNWINQLPLILGVAGWVLCWIPTVIIIAPIATIVTGIINLRRGRPRPPAIIGLSLATAELVVLLAAGVFLASHSTS